MEIEMVEEPSCFANRREEERRWDDWKDENNNNTGVKIVLFDKKNSKESP